MAPASPIPMDQIQKMDVQVTYWMMYEHMLEDFVHKGDLDAFVASTIIAGGVVTTQLGPQPVAGAKLTTKPLDTIARGKLAAYKAAIEGGKAVREAAIEGVELAIGS